MPLENKKIIIFWYSLVLLLVFSLLSLWPINSVLKYWDQPENIKYDLNKYRLFVIKSSSLNPVKLLFNSHDYIIGITRKTEEPEYGHYKKYSVGYGSESDRQLIEQLSIIWNEDGVILIEKSGHRLFFPKKSFIGGR